MFARAVLSSGHIRAIAIIIPFILAALTGSATGKQTDSKQTSSDAAAFEFAYETKDDEGNLQMHREQQDVHGRRTGTYGYQHANGLYRFVDYIADGLGYRATIRTNEPGTRSTLGAHVTVHAAPSPPGIDEPVPAKGTRRFAPAAPKSHNRVITQTLSRRPHVPLPMIVVQSPVPALPLHPIGAQLGSSARADHDEIPRVPDVPMHEIVHSADVFQPRKQSRVINPATLFPAPPLIRPPRYQPRSGKITQQGHIEAAFRRRRS